MFTVTFDKILSHRGWTIFVYAGLVIAIILGSVLFSFSTDFKIQTETAENWVAGKGLTFTPKNEPTLRPNRMWPPHYMLALGVGIRLGLTAEWVARILWAASCAVLVLLFAAMAKNAMGEKTERIFLGLMAFSPTLWMLAPGLDMFAAATVALALWLLTKDIARTDTSMPPRLFLNTLFTAALWVFAATTRYNYYPLVLVPTLIHGFYFIKTKKTVYKKSLLMHGILGVVLFGLYYWGTNLWLGERWNYVSKSTQGFYPENWLRFSAFALDGFGWGRKIVHLFPGKDTPWVVAFRVLSFVITLVALRYFVKNLQNKPLHEPKAIFSVLFLLIFVLVFGPLLGLSLTIPPQTWHPEKWTYIEESRYLILPIFGIFVIFCERVANSVDHFWKYIYVFLVSVNFLQGSWLFFKIFLLIRFDITNFYPQY